MCLNYLFVLRYSFYRFQGAHAYFVGKIQLHLHSFGSAVTLKLYAGAVLFGSQTNSTAMVAFATAPVHTPIGAAALAVVIVTPVPLGAHFGCIDGSLGGTQFARMAQPPLGSSYTTSASKFGALQSKPRVVVHISNEKRAPPT